MFTLLAFDAARDQVARQFVYGEPRAVAAPTRKPTSSAPRRRSNPFAALLRQVSGSLTHATWSPTR